MGEGARMLVLVVVDLPEPAVRVPGSPLGHFASVNKDSHIVPTKSGLVDIVEPCLLRHRVVDLRRRMILHMLLGRHPVVHWRAGRRIGVHHVHRRSGLRTVLRHAAICVCVVRLLRRMHAVSRVVWCPAAIALVTPVIRWRRVRTGRSGAGVRGCESWLNTAGRRRTISRHVRGTEVVHVRRLVRRGRLTWSVRSSRLLI